MRRAVLILDLLLIFLFTAVLIKPLFKAKYLDRWDSIESTFIADGRFLKDHWPHPQWQPLWYCGTRYDYLYPPALRYGTALLSCVYLPVKAYHFYTGLLYSTGIAGVYFLVWVTCRSRGAAWLAGAASALVSPAFLLIPPVRNDSLYLAPWRLWVLLRYGEGPHISSLALLPFALGFTWLALQTRRTASLAAAAVCCALVTLTNFYGATALAILYPILVWSLWVTHRDHRMGLRAAVIPALAYALSAFWLTPSYLRITVENLRYVSSPGNAWSGALLVLAAAVFLAVSLSCASRRPSRAGAVFVSGSLLFLGLNVLGHFYFKFRVIGEPGRLVPELDLAMILVGAELLRRLWNWPAAAPSRVRVVARAAAAMLVVCSAWVAWRYVRHAWDLYPRESEYRQRVEYRMSDWMAVHLSQARTLASGSVRFWWDTWHDLAQVGGGSEQGLLNDKVAAAGWEIHMGANPESAVRWLTALGADAVIVSSGQSQNPYRDFAYPDKFNGVLPVLYDDRQGNVIYQVPRRYRSLARVVDRARFEALQPLAQTNLELLRAYTAAIEEGPDAPTATAWNGTDAMRVHARVAPGQSILVQVTYDPAWHAYADGQALPVRRDRGAGFTVIDAPPGERDIAFVFETPLENRIGWVLTWLSMATTAALLAVSIVSTWGRPSGFVACPE